MAAVREYLVAGLGNTPFPHTRHSVGHLVVSALAKRHNRQLRPVSGVDCLCAETVVPLTTLRGEENVRVVFAINRTAPMNLSGISVTQALRHYFSKADPSKLILVHDSIYNELNTVHSKDGGSAKGHNGVRSVQSAMGTNDFPRILCGVGGGQGGGGLADYVLGPLSGREMRYWTDEGLSDVWDTIEDVMSETGEKRAPEKPRQVKARKPPPIVRHEASDQ